MTSRLLLALYHTLLKQAKSLATTGKTFFPRAALDKSMTGIEPYATFGRDYEQRILRHIVANIDTNAPFSASQLPVEYPCTGEWLFEEIRRQFKSTHGGIRTQEAAQRCFSMLRALSHQLQLERCSSRTVTNGVMVDLTTNYLGQAAMGLPFASSMGFQLHHFQYRVRVVNLREDTVQIKGRHWLFETAEGEVTNQVGKWGEGVIGQQPVIPPQEAVEYFSHAQVPPSTVRMSGAFLCHTGDGSELEIEIGPAKLLGLPPEQAEQENESSDSDSE